MAFPDRWSSQRGVAIDPTIPNQSRKYLVYGLVLGWWRWYSPKRSDAATVGTVASGNQSSPSSILSDSNVYSAGIASSSFSYCLLAKGNSAQFTRWCRRNRSEPLDVQSRMDASCPPGGACNFLSVVYRRQWRIGTEIRAILGGVVVQPMITDYGPNLQQHRQ